MNSKVKIALGVVGLLALVAVFAVMIVNRAQGPMGSIKPTGSGAFDVNGDPEVAAAVIQQQKTLDKFIERLQNPQDGDGNFGVNAKMRANGQVEQIWVNVDGYSDGMFAGRLANAPVLVKGLKKGDPVMVKKEEVSDWIYSSHGKKIGGLTIDVINKKMGR